MRQFQAGANDTLVLIASWFNTLTSCLHRESALFRAEIDRTLVSGDTMVQLSHLDATALIASVIRVGLDA
jgi:hypothetical protein